MHPAVLLLALLPLVPSTPPQTSRPAPLWARPGPAGQLDAHGVERSLFTSGEVVVVHAPGRAADSEFALRVLGASIVQRASVLHGLRVRLPQGMQPSEAVELFADLPGVVSVERNAVLTPCSIPNDPLYYLQYDARLVSAERAWDLTTGSSGVIVAVCDSGIASGLAELEGKLVAGTVTTPFSTTTEDVYGHGTAMASIIAARRNNGVGASGLAPGCRVMPVKVSSDQGLYTNFEVSGGIQWAADAGARVILVAAASPIGGPILSTAVQYAQSRNCLVVASAGNTSTTMMHYPAAIPGVLGVAGSQDDDTRLAESNHGGWVSIAAPARGLVFGPSGAYLTTTGTSTSAARVAAAAALVFSHLGSTTSQSTVRGRLVGNADPVPGNWVFGRLNIYDALVNQHSTIVSTDFPSSFLDGNYTMGTNWSDVFQDTPDERLRVEGVVFKQVTGLSFPVSVRTAARGQVQWAELVIEARSPSSTPMAVSIWDFQNQTWFALGTLALGPVQDTVSTALLMDWAERFYSDDDLREVHVRFDAHALGMHGPPPITLEIDSLRVITRSKQ